MQVKTFVQPFMRVPTGQGSTSLSSKQHILTSTFSRSLHQGTCF